MKSPRLPLRTLLPALAILLLAACETGPDRKAMREEALHSVPPMAGEGTFFDGAITAHLALGGGFGSTAYGLDHDQFKGDESMKTGLGKGALGSSMGEGAFGGMGGGGMGGGGRGGGSMGDEGDESSHDSRNTGGRRGSKDGTYQGNKGMRDESEGDDSDTHSRPRHRESEMPPALLRLRLANTTPATMIVEIRELNSILGNFAVRPEIVTLDPGKFVEVEPMQSLLGVDAFTVPVTISLRAGGSTETKVLTLQLVKPPAATPPRAH